MSKLDTLIMMFNFHWTYYLDGEMCAFKCHCHLDGEIRAFKYATAIWMMKCNAADIANTFGPRRRGSWAVGLG